MRARGRGNALKSRQVRAWEVLSGLRRRYRRNLLPRRGRGRLHEIFQAPLWGAVRPATAFPIDRLITPI